MGGPNQIPTTDRWIWKCKIVDPLFCEAVETSYVLTSRFRGVEEARGLRPFVQFRLAA
jgi:hypothetical protein